jgi:sugar lactone lactonase YvrE
MKNILLFFIFLLFSEFSHSQVINTIAGNGSSVYSGDGILATSAGIPSPADGVFDKFGNYYITDAVNSHRIRKIDPTGFITDIAGIGSGGFSGDGGSATLSRLNYPNGIALDTFGNIYIADANNHRIRKIDMTTGIITTIAGDGVAGYSGENVTATTAKLFGPNDICFDKFGNMYIADVQNYRIRKVDPAGIITTFAGTGASASSGDGGPATAADIWLPQGIATDDTGNVYIAEKIGNKVRKVNLAGIITTVAGNGLATYIGDGIQATSASINPLRIAISSMGELYIADEFNRRILKVDASGIIHSIAGNGISGFSGDGGSATSAQLNYPAGLEFDACGNLYIPDVSNRRIRKVTLNPPTTPTITLSGITTATVGATVTVSATVSGAGSSYTIRWFKNSALFSTTTTPTTTVTKGSGTDIITARIVPTIVYCYDSTTAEPHLVLEAPVGVGYVPEQQQYSVYPNPAQQQLSISSPAPIHTITISSPVGQQWLAYTGSGSTEVQLSIAHLPAGLYIVRVNNSYSTKMVKE